MNKHIIAIFIAAIVAALRSALLLVLMPVCPACFPGKVLTNLQLPAEIMLRDRILIIKKKSHLELNAFDPYGSIADPMKERNYSLHLITENFRFAPESVSMKPVFGEGHAHLYIDDVLICRIYGPWQHIPALKPGAQSNLCNPEFKQPRRIYGQWKYYRRARNN